MRPLGTLPPVAILLGALLCLSCTAASKSSEAELWAAGASVYSGRVDPSWEVSGDSVGSLMRCLEGLVPASNAAIPEPPGLGYRGAWVRAPDGREWRFFGGMVETSPASGTTRFRDPERQCERLVLRTAPAGVLPPGLP